MIRKKLKRLNKKRRAFIGTMVAFGTKEIMGYPQRHTLLLKDIQDIYGKSLTDHIWVNFPSQYDKLNLKRGDLIRFRATVKLYGKYHGKSKDYGLRNITGIKIVSKSLLGITGY